MPAESQAQYNAMQAAAHNPVVAKRMGIDQATAREFVHGQSPKGLPLKKAAGKLSKKGK